MYTRPAVWRGLAVPEVLASGHHAEVERWRRDQRLRRTAGRRPDLLARLDPATLSAGDLRVLADEGWEPVAGRFTRRTGAVAD